LTTFKIYLFAKVKQFLEITKIFWLFFRKKNAMEDKRLIIKNLVIELNEVHGFSVSEIARKADIKINILSDVLREPPRGVKNFDMVINRLTKLRANVGLDINIVEYEGIQTKLEAVISEIGILKEKIDTIIDYINKT